jgi:hypothetical protein
LSSILVPQNIYHHMIRQARTGDTESVKSREKTDRTQTMPRGVWGRRGKDDRKQNTLATPPHKLFNEPV